VNDKQTWIPYILYIAAVIDFYSALCAGRNYGAVSAIREKIGFSNTLIRAIFAPQDPDVHYHYLLKDALFRLCKTLIIDFSPYASWLDRPINVFIWSAVD
jgi:hypothetical protein